MSFFSPFPLPPSSSFLARLVLWCYEAGFFRLFLSLCANYCDPLTDVTHTHIYVHNTHTYIHLLAHSYALCVSLTDNRHLCVLPLSPSGFGFLLLIKTDFCRIFPLPSHTTPAPSPAEIVFLFRRLKYHCSWNVFGDATPRVILVILSFEILIILITTST